MTKKSSHGRERLDRVLVLRGLAASREQAGRLILAGAVRVDGRLVDKQAKLIPDEALVEVLQRGLPYVSRGGEKLKAGLDEFQIDVRGKIAMDVGVSTGGFTDCLLQRDVNRVYVVDVGRGLLDWKLRNDSRIIVLEGHNIRYLDRALVAEPIEVLVVDVSFISLTIVLPAIVKFLAEKAVLVLLVKPQFEVGKGQVGKGGIVREESLRQAALKKVKDCAERLKMSQIGAIDSPVPGQKGNREILLGLRWSKETL